MKVKELIEKLQECDDNLPVCLVSIEWLGGRRDITKIDEISDIHIDNSDYYYSNNKIEGQFVRIG